MSRKRTASWRALAKLDERYAMTKVDLYFVVLCAFLLLLGCSQPIQSVHFDFSDSSSAREYSYFPVVDRGEGLQLGRAFKKTFDAPGNHQARISATDPENLGMAWWTTNLAEYDRVGIVIMERDADDEPIIQSARVFWLSNESIRLTDQKIRVSVPPPHQLERFEVPDNFR